VFRRFLAGQQHELDVAAAQQKIADRQDDLDEADRTISTFKRDLQENRLEQIGPQVAIEKAEAEIKRLQAAYDSTYWTDQMRPYPKKLEPLLKTMQEDEDALDGRRAELESARREKSRNDARLDELKAQLATVKTQIVADARLVATTITGVYLNPDLLRRHFDVVLVDEVSMISVIAALLVALRTTKYFIAGGDPMQLLPILKTVCSEQERAEKMPEALKWLARDLLSYLGVTIFDAIGGKKGCILLVQQGRMHPKILAPINHGETCSRQSKKAFLSGRLDRGYQPGQRLFGVTEQHDGPGIVEQLVLDAGKAWTHRSLEEDHIARLVGIQNQHTVDVAPRRVPGSRVDHIVGTNHQRHIGQLELVVDLVHLLELLVRHMSLREQHVHMSRHPPRHRVDSICHLHPTLLEHVCQLPQRVLRLGHGQSVAGHEDDVARVGQQGADVFRGTGVHGACARSGARAGTGLHLAGGSEQDVRQRATHGVAHPPGQQHTGGTDQCPGHDQREVIEREPAGRHGQASTCVEQRNHDRHIGATDRQYECHAQDQLVNWAKLRRKFG